MWQTLYTWFNLRMRIHYTCAVATHAFEGERCSQTCGKKTPKMSYGRGPPEIDGMTSLKVDNLTYRTTPEDLRRAFDKYGDVGDVYIPRDRFTRESRGFAFVRFYDKRDAEDALDSMDGAIMDGRELRVQMARYGRPTEPYRRGPPRRNSGYRSRYRLEFDLCFIDF